MKRLFAILLVALMLCSTILPVSADSNYNDTIIDWSEHTTHVYDWCNDISCNVCGALREPDHVYDHNCDNTCNYCGSVRPIPGHQYDAPCDEDCNFCGAIRPIDHAYENACDQICDLCGAVRIAPHTYANACTKSCSLCGHIRDEVSDHVYDDSRDADCNECGAVRGIVTLVTQPQSVCVASGEMATVTFTATGDGLTYTWYWAKKGTSTFYKTTSFTSNTYSVEMNSDRNGRQIYCIVTDQYGNSLQTNTFTVNLLPHAYTDTVTQQPTCSVEGVKTYTCSTCGDSYTEAIAILDHTWHDATCTTPLTCAVCGATQGDALGHTWNDATCTAAQTCAVCGITQGNTLPHTYTATVTLQPTCTTAGIKTYACSCGDRYTIEIPAPGHTWSDATCTTLPTCTVCGVTTGETLAHDYIPTMTSQPTCTTAGVMTYTCSACGDTYTEAIDALEHTYTDTVTSQPTCTTEGVLTYTCSACGDTYTEAIATLPHEYVYIQHDEEQHWWECACGAEEFPYRFSHGYTRDYNETHHWLDCGDCGYVIEEDLHNYDNDCDPECNTCFATRQVADHVWIDATCTAPATCANCGVTQGEVLEHVYANACDAACDVCGANRQVGEHLWAKGTCSVCGIPSPNKVTITTQPKTTYAKDGATIKVTVKATGHGLKYTWYFKNASAKSYSKSSVKTATYSTTASATTHNRTVYCVITDQYGNSVKSSTATLRRQATITKEPVTSYAKKGAKISVKVTAVGDGLTYTWYFKNSGKKTFSKSSTKTATYSTTISSTTKNRQVYCIVKDKYGKTVQSKTVTLRESVSITTQPKTVTVKKNATAKVTVKASGDGLTYTWYFKNAGKKTFSKSSTKTASYSVKMTATTKNRQVYCVVKDKYGKTVKTVTVTLKMK